MKKHSKTLKKWIYKIGKRCILVVVLLAFTGISGGMSCAVKADEELAGEETGGRPIVVVIDPGHGGENAGAIYGGYIEKALTLNTALAMKEELEKYQGVEVYLTRESDTDLDLDERAEFAEEKNADILLSLHYNMSEYHKLYGAECYVSAFGSYYAIGKDFSDIEMELLTDEGLYDRGVKTRLNSRGTDYYGIIRSGTAKKIPTVIIEHCHLDQENDKPYIDHNTWSQKYGVIDATAVAKYFGLKSEELSVDYSTEVHTATPIPDEKVKPDDTPPTECNAEILSVDEETGAIKGKISAYDPDSRILYYTFSFNNGKSFGEYYKYEPDENGEVFFEIQAPDKKRTRLVAAALNLYGGMTKTDLLYVGRMHYKEDAAEEGDTLQNEDGIKAGEGADPEAAVTEAMEVTKEKMELGGAGSKDTVETDRIDKKTGEKCFFAAVILLLPVAILLVWRRKKRHK